MTKSFVHALDDVTPPPFWLGEQTVAVVREEIIPEKYRSPLVNISIGTIVSATFVDDNQTGWCYGVEFTITRMGVVLTVSDSLIPWYCLKFSKPKS